MFNETFKRKIAELKCRLAHADWWRSYEVARSHDRMSADELAAFNWQKRLEILKYAFENSDYYHNLYSSAGLEPGDVKSESDWVKVPMLTREALRENFETLCIRNLKQRGDYRIFKTGGSTGQPSKVAKDALFSSRGMNYRGGDWSGVPQGLNQATVMRFHPEGWRAKFRNSLVHYPSHSIFLDASAITEEAMERFFDEWRRYPPASVTAYAGGLQHVALYCQRKGIELPAPRAIFTTASPVDRMQRLLLHKVFRAPVFDSYVATEANPMAGQCRCCAEKDEPTLHIHSDYRHLEFVNEDGLPMPVGEEGDILVTDMGDHAFPIVRYRLGDRGRALPGRCECGLPYPIMDAVRGRMGYKIYLEKGILTGGWTVLFEEYPNAVHGFQIHQFADKSVKLSVVLNRAYADAEKEVKMVAAAMQKKLGALPLSVDYVESLPHDRGKLKYIICDVKE